MDQEDGNIDPRCRRERTDGIDAKAPPFFRELKGTAQHVLFAEAIGADVAIGFANGTNVAATTCDSERNLDASIPNAS